MTLHPDDTAAVLRVRASLAGAARALQHSRARDEAIGAIVEPRPILGVRRAPRMVVRGRVWRVGVLLLDAAGAAWSTGAITRVTPAGRPQHLSTSVEERRALRSAAIRGGIAEGESVNHDTVPIALDDSLVDADGPLFVREGAAWVRWSTAPNDPPMRLEDYLADRLSLLLEPPAGA